MSLTKQIQELIEASREQYVNNYLHFLIDSPDGTICATATLSNGTAFNIKPYLNESGSMNVQIKYESIGNDGLIHYGEDSLTFTARFSGNVVTLNIPYSCMLYLVNVNSPDDKDVIDFRVMKNQKPTDAKVAVPLWLLRTVVKYASEEYPEIPLFGGLSIDGKIHYVQLTDAIFNDEGDNRMYVWLPHDHIVGTNEEFELTPINEPETQALSIKAFGREEVKYGYFVDLFTPPSQTLFIYDNGQLGISSPGLTEAVKKEIERLNPMALVNADVPLLTLEAVKAPESPNEGPSRIDVGETTEVSQGNVTAVDFRNRKVLK